MNKQLCFLIGKQNLYLEKNLVLFNDIPIFFICSNEDNQRYLVLCTELERLEYLVVKTNLTVLRNMLIQKCSMREAILKGEKFWEVVSGNTVEEDLCEELELKKINLNILPNEGAMYNTVYQEDDNYVEHIESEYLDSIKFDVMDGVDILTNSVDLLSESVTSVIETIAYSITTVVGYLDIGSSIDSITNGMEKILSNTKIDVKLQKKVDYRFHAEDNQDDIMLRIKSNNTMTIDDKNTNLAA